VARQQQRLHRLKQRLRTNVSSARLRHSLGAVLLLLLSAQSIAAATELTKDDVDFRKEVYVNKDGDRLPYRLFVPLDYDANRKYPLIVWLHGNDGRGDDNLKQITGSNHLGTHFWIASEVQLKFPAFVFAPQCPPFKNWAEPEFNQPSKWLLMATEALAKVQREFSIDPGRIYIVGQAMGGIGVWSLLQNYQGKWAGAMVISAYDNFSDVPAIAEVPLWVFQATDDPYVPITMVHSMMAQLRKAHANLRYTEYPKVTKDAWNKAFAEPDLLPWLSGQKRPAPAASQVGTGAKPAPQ
jgi:predicted peptidase